MKLLCLGDIHSIASLQDALFGKGLPPIQCEAVEESSDEYYLCDSQYDWILIRNSESIEARHKELGKAIHQLQFATCLSVSLQQGEGYNMPMKILEQEQETVVFEYHATCAPTIKSSLPSGSSFQEQTQRNNNKHC